jgi:hypothetical protein
MVAAKAQALTQLRLGRRNIVRFSNQRVRPSLGWRDRHCRLPEDPLTP